MAKRKTTAKRTRKAAQRARIDAGRDKRSAWVWVRPPADDPVVRARTALTRIKRRREMAAFGWLETDIRAVLKQREVVRTALQKVRQDEEALIYLLIANAAFEQLVSRQHHISRGRLSAEGRLVLSAYKRATSRLVQFGVYDEVTYDAILAALRQRIREGG